LGKISSFLSLRWVASSSKNVRDMRKVSHRDRPLKIQ
jgi:hypothetical protein